MELLTTHIFAITWTDMRDVAIGFTVLAMLLAVAHKLEGLRPIEPHNTREARQEIIKEYKHAVLHRLMAWLVSPLSGACAAAIVNAAGGGGFIDLRGADHWYSWLASFLFFVVIYDAYRYWLHRLSHMVPILWELHSFHHSAERITIITGARHLWLDGAVGAAFFPLMAILFKVSPQMVLIVQLLYAIPDGCAHLNYRLSLGRYVVLLNNPQWHRIHHSVEPQHINKNFASLFPFMDILFGTAFFPARDEFPETGLVPKERPGVLEGLLWPVRRLLRNRTAFLPR